MLVLSESVSASEAHKLQFLFLSVCLLNATEVEEPEVFFCLSDPAVSNKLVVISC